jgi:hypothetical protein
MNREDIIKMAKKAGLSGMMEGGLIDYFERFAALIAAAEREACAQLAEKPYMRHTLAAAIRARGNT